MADYIDNELKKLLAAYTVDEPDIELVAATKTAVHRELAPAIAVAPERNKWVFVLAGLALSMALCVFYMITVGAALRFFLPDNLVTYIRYSVFVCMTFGGGMFALTMLLAGYHEITKNTFQRLGHAG